MNEEWWFSPLSLYSTATTIDWLISFLNIISFLDNNFTSLSRALTLSALRSARLSFALTLEVFLLFFGELKEQQLPAISFLDFLVRTMAWRRCSNDYQNLMKIDKICSCSWASPRTRTDWTELKRRSKNFLKRCDPSSNGRARNVNFPPKTHLKRAAPTM